jgi:uncharacterized membrane protein
MNKLLERITEAIARFLGSWRAVVFHLVWFFLWLALGWNLNFLTLLFSLDVILIGIFLLMAANEAEREREVKECLDRTREMEEIKSNAEEAQIQTQVLAELRRANKEMAGELAEIKRMIRKTQGAIESSANQP